MAILTEHRASITAADPEETTLLVTNPVIYITLTQLLSSPNLTNYIHKIRLIATISFFVRSQCFPETF
jgi:hypothetical protein